MSFVSNKYEQLGFKDSLIPLSDRERKVLETSWASAFADDIFPYIDESGFAVLFSSRSPRPNVPVNVLIGALLLKGFMDLTDEELVSSAMFDIRFQMALHTTSANQQPLSVRTLSRFRSRCSDFADLSGVDLIADCLAPLSGKLAAFAAAYFRESRFDFAVFAAGLKGGGSFRYQIVKNPAVFEENRLEARSDHLVFAPGFEPGPSYRAAFVKPEDTGFVYSLNGIWKFSWAPNAQSAVQGFEKTSFDCRSWEDIRVPAHIQMESLDSTDTVRGSWDRPAYVNVQYPWDGREKISPGQVPSGTNPVGSYVRYFRLPEFMEGRKVRICFRGVESGLALWCNGRYVGYSEDSFTPSEFDLTPYIRAGENKLACQVFKWTASSWLEDQDFFRFSGIYRDVYLYTVPEVHAEDLKVRALPDPDLQGAELELALKIRGSGGRLEYSLTGPEGCVLSGSAEAEEETLIREHLESVRLWSAEDPVLYDLRIRVLDREGRLQETVCEKTGFRRFEMKDGLMVLNGKRIVFRGVNRHDFSCDRGRAVGLAEALEDVVTMKRNNINAIRTSHYPDVECLYRLCDEYGLYMIAENNMESHGSWSLIPGGLKKTEDAVPGDRKEWRDLLLDRVNSCYQRDKNHAAVLIWSVGNESFGGPVIRDMADLFRSLDPDRLVHYEGIFNDRRFPETSDMESQMYPSVEAIRKFLAENPGKPFICCEYSHAMGNSLGGMHKYTDLTDEEPRYQGGFIWDFVDQAVRSRDRYGKEYLAYGGDMMERPTDYDFSGDGLLTADRRPYAKLEEARFNYQTLCAGMTPVVSGDQKTVSGRVRIINKNLFTSSDAFSACLTLEKEGRLLEKRSLETGALPLSEEERELPAMELDGPGEYVLTLSFRLRKDTLWAGAGYETAWSQAVFTAEGEVPEKGKASEGPVRLIQGDFNLGIRGDQYEALFSLQSGTLVSLRYGGRELIRKAPRPGFWRAPTANDRGNHMAARYGQWKLADLYGEPVTVRAEDADARGIRVRNGKGGVRIMVTYALPTNPAAEAELTYVFGADGRITLSMDYDPVPGLSVMPEFGFLFTLNADYDRITYYGLGPHENYCDRNRGARLGVHTGTAAGNAEPYLVPQETGNRTGVRWARVQDRLGRGILFEAEKEMDFSAIPYTPAELESAEHPYELPPVHNTIVRCSLGQMGVGGDDSWGARTHDEYLPDISGHMHFSVTFRGI